MTLLAALLAILLPNIAAAQIPNDTPPAPIRKMFGVPDSSFFLSAWCKALDSSTMDITRWTRTIDSAGATISIEDRSMTLRPANHPDAHNERVWDFAESMGIDILRREMDWAGFPDVELDAEARSRADSTRFRLILSRSEIIDRSSYGSEATFYFTDSIRYREEPTAFASRAGGTDGENSEELDDNDDPAREMVYDTSTTTAGQLIADRPTFKYKPIQSQRWEWYDSVGWRQRPDSQLQNSDYFFRRFHQNGDTVYHVAVKGRLFDEGSAPDTATLLRVEIWYERPRMARHQIWNGSGYTPNLALGNDTFLIARHFVRKSDLAPQGLDPFEKYREASFEFHPRFIQAGATGTLFEGNDSRSINIKVYWTGAERVALHALYLRDDVGQRVMTDEVALRDLICARAAEMVYRDPAGTRLRSVIAVSLAGENPAIQSGPQTRVSKWIRECMNANADPVRFDPPGDAPADSLGGFIEEKGNTSESLNRLYDLDYVASEGISNLAADWMRDVQ